MGNFLPNHYYVMKFAIVCLIANIAAVRITTCPNTDAGGYTESATGRTAQNAAGCYVSGLAKACPNTDAGGYTESATGRTAQNAAGCYVAGLARVCPNTAE